MLLIVEDNETLQLFMRTLVQRRRWKAIFARDAIEALELFRQNEAAIDLVFMDWNLPGMDGLTCASKMRERHEDLPIIAITAHATSEHRTQCIEAGMSDFLSKPFTTEQFAGMVSRWAESELPTTRASA